MKGNVFSNVTSYWLAVSVWSVILTRILRLQEKKFHDWFAKSIVGMGGVNVGQEQTSWVKGSIWMAGLRTLLLKSHKAFKKNRSNADSQPLTWTQHNGSYKEGWWEGPSAINEVETRHIASTFSSTFMECVSRSMPLGHSKRSRNLSQRKWEFQMYILTSGWTKRSGQRNKECPILHPDAVV